MSKRILSVCLLLLLPAFICACGAGGAGRSALQSGAFDPPSPPVAAAPLHLPALPAPGSFSGSSPAAPPPAPPRESSGLFLGFSKNQLSQSLPMQNIGSQPDTFVYFEPSVSTEVNGLNGLSFAGFEVPLADPQDVSPVLQFGFVETGELADLHVAIANYDTNRWDWYQPESLELLRINSWEPYHQTGSPLLVVIAVEGTQPWKFSIGWIGNPLPGFMLSHSADSYQIPAEVTVTVSSVTAPADLSAIQWDMDNDGSFEHESPPGDKSHSFVYDSLGLKTARVRLLDAIGEPNEKQITFHCTDHAARTWGLSGDEQANGITRDSAGNIYICGSRDGESCLLLKYNAQMNLVWAREWDNGGANEQYTCIACLNDQIFVAGPHVPLLGFSTQMLLHKWSDSGDLLSQKLLGQDNQDTFPQQLLAHNGAVLVCGSGFSSSDFEQRALIQSFSPALERNWGTAVLDTETPQELNQAVALAASAADGIYVLIGENGGSGGFALLRLNEAGLRLHEQYYDGSSELVPGSLFLDSGTVHLVSTTGTSIILARFSQDCLLQDDLAIDSGALPGGGGFIDSAGRWVFCAADGADASYWQIDYEAVAGRWWSYEFSGSSNVSGALQLLNAGNGYSFICGLADRSTGLLLSSHEILSADFSQPSASTVDPDFDLSNYSVSLSSTSRAPEDIIGIEDIGADFSTALGDMALFRFGSEE